MNREESASPGARPVPAGAAPGPRHDPACRRDPAGPLIDDATSSSVGSCVGLPADRACRPIVYPRGLGCDPTTNHPQVAPSGDPGALDRSLSPESMKRLQAAVEVVGRDEVEFERAGAAAEVALDQDDGDPPPPGMRAGGKAV